jgi:hypothetical protein
MNHVVYLNSDTGELEKLIAGSKTMIIRGADAKELPHGRVAKGDVLYFLNNDGEDFIRAKGEVSFVINSDKLTVEESFEIIIRNQDKLQLPDEQFYTVAGKRYLVLIGLSKVERTDLMPFDRSQFRNMIDWIPVGDKNIFKSLAN